MCKDPWGPWPLWTGIPFLIGEMKSFPLVWVVHRETQRQKEAEREGVGGRGETREREKKRERLQASKQLRDRGRLLYRPGIKTLKSFLALPQQRASLHKVQGSSVAKVSSPSPLVLFDWTPGSVAWGIIPWPKCNECKPFTVYSCGYNSWSQSGRQAVVCCLWWEL